MGTILNIVLGIVFLFGLIGLFSLPFGTTTKEDPRDELLRRFYDIVR